MSNLTEGTIILNTQLEKNLKKKKSCKINNFKKYFAFLISILILIAISTMILGLIKINNMKQIKFNNKSDTSLNEILTITHDNYYKIGVFNKEINDKYIKSQNYFCNNQNIFYNKMLEDKIKLIDVKFNDKKFKMFVYRNSDIVSDYIIRDKAWEVDETQNLLKALNYYSNKNNIKRKDIYIIDIGANIGWYSFILGKYGYKIISFEPSKINNYILKKNYCLNKEINITIINKGLYNEEKKCYLYSEKYNEGNGFLKCEINQNLSDSFEKIGEIILTKLSNYLPFFMNKNLVLVKMDIEGAERNAIDGGIDLISKYHVPFIFFEFSPTYLKRLNKDPKELLQLFVDYGYKMSIIGFFNNYISVDDIMRQNKFQINIYLVYSKILE